MRKETESIGSAVNPKARPPASGRAMESLWMSGETGWADPVTEASTITGTHL
jgi:hypothetical protein